ncbi:MAG: hypothetical protein AAFO67_03745, partial [Planctomycetota bacterium]
MQPRGKIRKNQLTLLARVVREAVARLRRALLDPHLTDHFRQQGQLILSDLAPRLQLVAKDRHATEG